MNFLDLLFGIPLLWFAYKGFTKGLIVEIASLAALVAGIYLAVNFSWWIGGHIERITGIKNQTSSMAAFAVTFLGVVIMVHFTGRMVSKMVENMSLGFLNKLAGGAFGLLKAAFIISVVLYLYGRIDRGMKLIPEKMREESFLYQPVAAIAPTVVPRLEAERDKMANRKESGDEAMDRD